MLRNRGGRERTTVQRNYRGFLLGVLCYYITDALWGVLDAHKLTALQFADTSLYFVAMAAALLMWTRYVVAYLETDNAFGRALSIAGRVFFALGLAAVAANLLTPVMFWFDEAGGYHAGVARYATLGVQVLMFLLTSVYTLYVTSKSEGTVRRRQVHPHHALTANAFDEDVQRSLQAGLNAHLSKPVEPQALFDTLEELIRARRGTLERK